MPSTYILQGLHSTLINDSLSDWADGGQAGTLITLSVLGTLVFIVILLIVVFFTQRKFVANDDAHPGTPKISRSSTNQLIADVANGLVAHMESPKHQDQDKIYLNSYDECGQIPSGDLATFRPSGGLLPPALPNYDCRRSAGDGGSINENNYSSLKNLHDELEQESPYAMVRQPDGQADEPTYSSLK